MNLSIIIIISLIIYSIAAMTYVYRWRGEVRYESLSQYLRKSWPIFAPFNCFLYMATHKSARHPILDAHYLKNIQIIRENWTIIREEAIALASSGLFDVIKTPGADGYYDVGFRTFYKRGWSKFYLKWYGTTHVSAQRLCPKTLALLHQVPEIRGAMFSLLPAGSELSFHADPIGSSLRYHLGLATPNSENCQINIDGQTTTWFDGEDFVFDETYPHFAYNNTNSARLILMCDVERPMNIFGRIFNMGYRILVKGTVVPNTSEDKRGVFSTLFKFFAPFRQYSIQFREKNFKTYKTLKFILNLSLLCFIFIVLYGVFYLFEILFVNGQKNNFLSNSFEKSI
ncbi:aspartyl/asparaginyl beta-hydroxylase domain-containing protein [Acinetobacter bereziniae]|uniref:aspartyl/asparaginyl beta-hydroxylase domain-containing protein n=1 Tax=Acinetobacter bereziniae TaxID=106648 RepID=UPI0021CF261E|nr:aspartyl/asparaginyl beta-hydroxylase domain-containing protein [Acinetobacter bereziniae]MCU4317133.1 aspartyl/asparaginyl beta-hydroxylase domain-containing protein [Acinetobacter bereziniae]